MIIFYSYRSVSGTEMPNHEVYLDNPSYEIAIARLRQSFELSCTPIVTIQSDKNELEKREYMAYCIEQWKGTPEKETGLRWNWMRMVYDLEWDLGIRKTNEFGDFEPWYDNFKKEHG